MAEPAFGEGGDAFLAHRRASHLVRYRPLVERALVVGHSDPEDAAAGFAQRRGEAVDRQHDVARRRADRVPDRLVHKGVLQIDDDERGARRVELGKRVLGATPGDDPLDDGVGNGGALQFHRDAP